MKELITQLSMSSLAIADLTEKEHKNVLRDIRKMFFELGYDSAHFSAQYIDDSGKANIMFELPRREVDILVSGYNIKYRAAIIDRWYELEQENTLLLKQQAELLKINVVIEKSKHDISKYQSMSETRNLKLQSLKDKLVRDKAVLESKAAKLISQGSIIKGDMSTSKLSMPIDNITNLLLSHGSTLTPAEANNALVRLGFLSLDKTEVTALGSYYGRSIKPSPRAKTSVARWFVSEFSELLPILAANK